MPIEIGLLSSQQDSFEHHEELSKLLNETDVFYVPIRNDFNDNGGLNTNQDLTKRFDEDLSNKHLIVTFRDIGYSVFLDSVESIPDVNDQSKIRVSGKMIVDGICVQFLGCFNYGENTEKHSDSQTQQINGVGRIQLDEEYYRELSSTQTSFESNMIEEEEKKKVLAPKTRQQTAKLKETSNKPKTRSRAISESVVPKTRTSVSTSPPQPVQITTPTISHSSVSTTRPRLYSPTHMPYPLRSPRIKQHRTLSPLHFTPITTSRTSEVHSSLISTAPSNFNEYSQISTSTPSVESSQIHRIQIISQSPQFSSPPSTGQTTMPIQIPSVSNTGLPTASFPQLTNFFPLPSTQSLPAYILPSTNIAYISTNPSGTSFDFPSLPANTSMFLITNSSQHPSQPIHILTPIDHRSLQFAHYTPSNFFSPPPPPPPPLPSPSRTCNILPSTSTNDSMSILQNKRHENEEDKQNQVQIETNKQFVEQLPFKKRRYAGQQTRMATVHDDDDDVSDESVKK